VQRVEQEIDQRDFSVVEDFPVEGFHALTPKVVAP
jgi:hypothetical protein